MSESVALMPLNEVVALAKYVVGSKMFGMQTEDQAVALMMLCQADNIHPMKAVQRYDIIQGKPAMKAQAMLAEFNARGGKHQIVKSNDKECIIKLIHPNGWDYDSVYTMEMAKREKLATKDNYLKNPDDMLFCRAASKGVRKVIPGVSVGIYTPEEVAEFDEPAEPIAMKITTPMAQIASPKEPDIVDGECKEITVPTGMEEKPVAEKMMTEAQRKSLWATYKTKEAIQAVMISVLGVAKSSKELTKAEASKMLDYMPPSVEVPKDSEIEPELDLDADPFTGENKPL